ncbi:MAG: hypothetical protein JW990_18200 [Thermoleophilia bacterium]|nr:hypothetical protein [Thermoleophilia bacterium]
MQIVECPKCGHPRPAGQRCPSCGDAATATDGRPSPQLESRRTDTARSGRGPAAAAAPASGRRAGTRWSALIAVVICVAAIAAIAIPLTQGDATPDTQGTDDVYANLLAQAEEMTGEDFSTDGAAGKLAAADQYRDIQARALLENAMQIMNDIILELEGECPTTEYRVRIRDALRLDEHQPLEWVYGTQGVHLQPLDDVLAEENGVCWSFVPPCTYELGTWSGSGRAIGVRVDQVEWTITFYKDGVEGF